LMMLQKLKIKSRKGYSSNRSGHGGEDLGTCYRDIYEKNLNLDVSIRLGKLLENNGIKVVYTRTGDESVELKTRSELQII
jgi:N-acetylmuramoyl-L-alanine amidase